MGDLKKKERPRGDIVDRHPPGKEVFQIGEAVGKGEGELLHRTRPCLADVIAGYGERIESRTPLAMNHSCTSPRSRMAKSGGNMLSFWACTSFRMSACTVPRSSPRVRRSSSSRSSSESDAPRSASARSRSLSRAATKYMARITGAGPLMVMEVLISEELSGTPPATGA